MRPSATSPVVGLPLSYRALGLSIPSILAAQHKSAQMVAWEIMDNAVVVVLALLLVAG